VDLVEKHKNKCMHTKQSFVGTRKKKENTKIIA
jgi:hypothetical protein